MSTNRPELVICQGLQASGKTTWAHAWVAEDRKNRARVNRDDLRQMVDNGKYVEGVTEGRILVARDSAITSLLRRGISVVSDDTNLRMKNVRDLAKLAVHGDYDWRVQDFTDVALEVCLARNYQRNELLVGHPNRQLNQAIVVDTYNRFIKGKKLPLPLPDISQLAQGVVNGIGVRYLPDRRLRGAIIIDIDGTVALRGTRSPFDETRVNEDVPNRPMVDAIEGEIRQGVYPIFLSGRTSGCRKATEDWLETWVVHRLDLDMHQALPVTGKPYTLFMRAEGDRRIDWEIKLEIFDQHIRDHYNVLRVYDDRNQVVEMWRSIGLTCLQVAPGNF